MVNRSRHIPRIPRNPTALLHIPGFNTTSNGIRQKLGIYKISGARGLAPRGLPELVYCTHTPTKRNFSYLTRGAIDKVSEMSCRLISAVHEAKAKKRSFLPLAGLGLAVAVATSIIPEAFSLLKGVIQSIGYSLGVLGSLAMVRNESSPPQAHQILELLPHRYPCLLIDRIVEIQRGCVVALKNVTFNEPYFQGHFPDNPVMPGVLQIEAMVKASGILATYQTEFNPQTHVMILMEMNNIKFRKPVKPGDQLRIEVTLLLEDKIFKMKGEIRCGEEIVSSAEFLAMLVPKSN